MAIGLVGLLLLLSIAWRVSGDTRRDPSAEPVAEPSFLGTQEIRASNLTRFTKWLDVLDRWRREQSEATAICDDDSEGACVPKDWARLVQELKGAGLRTSVQRVNEAINRYPFVASTQNWGKQYWETPFEFVRHGGQCQDYAIAKFMLLRELGVANEKLRFVIVQDLRDGDMHAVSVAYVDDDVMLMDNLLAQAESTTRVTWYMPYYSINETNWWRHLPAEEQISRAGDIARGRIAVSDAPGFVSEDEFNAINSCARR